MLVKQASAGHLCTWGPTSHFACLFESLYIGVEHVSLHRQVEKDEQYAKAVAGMGAVAENIMRANNAIDIYEDYFDHE